MSNIKNAVLLDKLLDKWDIANTDPTGKYFQQIVGLLPTPATTTTLIGTTFADLQTVIKKLYLVFHYPTYDTTGGVVTFDSKTDIPKIDDAKGVFNYVLPEPIAGVTGKRLLSSAGIGKKDMINLKMVIDKIATATSEEDVIKLLIKEDYADITGITMGGNNTTDILPKNTGGKNNKSNKRIKKQPRRRNKSSKSLK